MIITIVIEQIKKKTQTSEIMDLEVKYQFFTWT